MDEATLKKFKNLVNTNINSLKVGNTLKRAIEKGFNVPSPLRLLD